TESRVHCDSLAEPVNGFASFVLRRKQEAFQCQGLGVSRSQCEALVQGIEGAAGVAEAEFQFCHARPRKAKLGRVRSGLSCQIQRLAQRNVSRRLGLFIGRSSEKLGSESRAER